MGAIQTLRQEAAAYDAKIIDVQSIHFRQGAEIAQTYVDVILSYARLDAKSGRFAFDGSRRIVEGFCRIDEAHFGQPLLKRSRKQNFFTSQWVENVRLQSAGDEFTAFCTSFAELCKSQQIEIGELAALVRTKEGKLEQRPFPVSVTTPAYLEAIGFPYKIAF